MKITKEIRSDLEHLLANLDYFTDAEIGVFIREVLEREKINEPI